MTGCIYCGAEREKNCRMCYACHNDTERRERLNPIKPFWRRFLYPKRVRT